MSQHSTSFMYSSASQRSVHNMELAMAGATTSRSVGCGSLRLVIFEIVQWVTLFIPTILTAHQLVQNLGTREGVLPSLYGAPIATFWWIFGCAAIGVSLFVYFPTKYMVHRRLDPRKQTWRPAVLLYNLFCGGPCFAFILLGTKIFRESRMQEDVKSRMYDEAVYFAAPVIVFGLILTEWFCKGREDLASNVRAEAMIHDFLTVYDMLELVATGRDTEVYESYWIYAVYGVAFVSMFKFVPRAPSCDYSHLAKPYLIVNLALHEVPYCVVRIALIALFGLKQGKLIYPLKNFLAIVFRLYQLHDPTDF
ncbi:transmembrane protein 236-like [Branchiostoma floridae]|uniref:Transmembrane protein 236-like n=1 Tax=Branchiostoma floridae TaxID=7739 RepID=A0A9J7HIB7_BRAFL|nr:transmembrane protein 236-like [Branchiostoma floridae]